MNCSLPPRRDRPCIENAEAVALATDPWLADVAGAAADLAPSIRHRILRGDEPAGETGRRPAMRRCPNSPRSHATTLHAGLHIGDDGQPQGRQVPHRIYAAAGQGFKHWMQATPATVSLPACPFTHANIQYTRPWERWPPGPLWSSSTALAPRGSEDRCARPAPPW